MKLAPSPVGTSLLSGLAGAAALTAIHETARRVTSAAPRMDPYGRRAIAKGMLALGVRPPSQSVLQWLALAGEFLSNGVYFALSGAGKKKHSLRNGALLGILAGIGAVVLPPRRDLGSAPSRRSNQTIFMTILWYALGGLASAAVYQAMTNKREHDWLD